MICQSVKLSLKCSSTYIVFALFEFHLHEVWVVLDIFHDISCSNQRLNEKQCYFITLTFLLHFAQDSPDGSGNAKYLSLLEQWGIYSP